MLSAFFLDRVPTGIKGLDELLGGGFPDGRCILIVGSPGSGKTTFALQYLYHGAMVVFPEPGLPTIRMHLPSGNPPPSNSSKPLMPVGTLSKKNAESIPSLECIKTVSRKTV